MAITLIKLGIYLFIYLFLVARHWTLSTHLIRSIEHWRQAKAKLPPFGPRKHTFSSYFAEFLWRYEHKGEDLLEVFLEDVKKIYGKF
jgi:hypothetical protein